MSMILKDMVKEKSVKVINFQAEDAQIKAIRDKAKRYTKGNLSEWVRYAAMRYEPHKSELMFDPADGSKKKSRR